MDLHLAVAILMFTPVKLLVERKITNLRSTTQQQRCQIEKHHTMSIDTIIASGG